jgi:hypothetical protein
MSLEEDRSNLVPTLEVGLDKEGGVLLEDSFFGVKGDLVLNPPCVVFAADREEDLFYNTQPQGYTQQNTTPYSNSNNTGFTTSISSSSFNEQFSTDFGDSATALSLTAPPIGWQEQNQDLWFLGNITEDQPINNSDSNTSLIGSAQASNIRESTPSKEEILEEIRMEVEGLEAAKRSPSPGSISVVSSGSASPGLESGYDTPGPVSTSPGLTSSSSYGSLGSAGIHSSGFIRPQEQVVSQDVIYLDGEPVLSIPADQIPAELYDKEIFFQVSREAGAGVKLLPSKERLAGVSKKSTAASKMPFGANIKYNQAAAPGGTKKKAGRWTTSRIADPKERKKAQNREAAQRYRLKKQQEKDSILSEFEREEVRNMNLRKKVLDLEHEIKYLKGLMQEIRGKNAE